MREETSTASASAASIATEESLGIRVSETNPDHHLWNNHGTWWCHFTVQRPGYTGRRLRLSLETRDLAVARLRRDRLFDQLNGEETC